MAEMTRCVVGPCLGTIVDAYTRNRLGPILDICYSMHAYTHAPKKL